MSLTTRCPACGTIFRVVAEQLRLSGGWVRCGHCADVFDANLFLAPWPPVPASVPIPESPAQPTPLADTAATDPAPPAPAGQAGQATTVKAFAAPAPAIRVRRTADLSANLTRFETDRMPHAAAVAAPAGSPPTTSPSRTKDTPDERRLSQRLHRMVSVVSARQTPFGQQNASRPDINGKSVSLPPPGRADLPTDAVAERTAATTTPKLAHEPVFLQQARRRAFWHSPAVRGGLSLLVLLLLALLIAQWAVHDRDRLAARYPALAPALLQLCAPLGCQLAPPRHIEAVVIDSTTLVRRLANFYAFDVVLKNTAPMAVAMPALELSLTDAQDRVIARRVFLASDMPGTPRQLAPQSSLALSLRLSVADAAAEALPMAGYRALVFYP